MSLKDIFGDYKKKRSLNKELKELKSTVNKEGKLTISVMPEKPPSKLKGILEEFKHKVELKEQEKAKKLLQEINSSEMDTLNKNVNLALNNLKEEFEHYGEERTSNISIVEQQYTFTVFQNSIQEFIYKITIKSENNRNSVKIIVYETNEAGDITSGREEKLSTEKAYEITEELIRNNFYEVYKNFLFNKV